MQVNSPCPQLGLKFSVLTGLHGLILASLNFELIVAFSHVGLGAGFGRTGPFGVLIGLTGSGSSTTSSMISSTVTNQSFRPQK